MTVQAEPGSVPEGNPPPAGNPAPPAPPADNGSAADAPKSWFAGLSEGNLKIAEAKGWTKPDASIDKVLTSYVELERQQGESLRVPAPDAPKDEWDKFHSKLPEDRRPVASPDKIEFKRPEGLPADLPYDENLANTSKAWMVEAGLTSKQSQIMHDKFAGQMAEMATAQQAAIAKSVETTHDDLVKDWGPKDSDGFKAKLAIADRAMKKLGLVDSYKAKGILLADGSLTDPQIAKAFQAIGEAMFKEDTINNDPASSGVNPFKRGADGKIVSPSAISALIQSDPERAKRLCREAGENPDQWFPNNPR